MSLLTEILSLFKYDPAADGAQTFNIEKALNENWDRIDAFAKITNQSLSEMEDLASSGVRIVIGAEAPASGPALWFNTGAAAAAAQEAAMLSLNDDEDTGSVIAEVEGQQYAVENATIDTEPTTPGVYDFTIL